MAGNAVLVYASIALVLMLAILPNAAAMNVEGHLLLEGPANFPAGTMVDFTPLAALSNNTSGISAFTIRADAMQVTLYEKRYIDVFGIAGTRTEQSIKTWPQTNAELTLLDGGDHSGYFGIEGDPTGRMKATVFAATTLESRHETVISSGIQIINPTPEYPAFHASISQPHLYAKAPVHLDYDGPGTFHLNGIDFQLTAAENETSIEWRTGYVQTSPAESVDRWFILELQGATIAVSPGSMTELAGTDAAITWNGDARMKAVGGILRTPSGEYLPTGAPATLGGSFTADAIPPGASNAIQLLNLQGNVRTTDFMYETTSLAPFQNAIWLPWVALAATVSVGSGAGVLLLRQRRRLRPSRGEDYFNHAIICVEAGDYDGGLEWARQGRTIAPRMANLAAHEALCLAAKRDIRGAIKAYGDAHRLSDHGDFALAAARLLRDEGWPLENIQSFIVDALEKSPEYLHEIEQDFPDIVNSSNWPSIALSARLRSR